MTRPPHQSKAPNGDSRTIDPTTGSLAGLVVCVFFVAVVLLPYGLIWGLESLQTTWGETSAWVMLIAFVIGVIVHELIHAAAWCVSGKLPWSEMKFAINWSALSPTAHTRACLPAKAYRIGAAMPAIVLGVLPAVIGLSLGSPRFTIFGTTFLCVAAGDTLILWKMRDVPGSALVQDHPTLWGCLVHEGPGRASVQN